MSIRENGFREKIDSGKWFSGKNFRENIFSVKRRFEKITIREKKIRENSFRENGIRENNPFHKNQLFYKNKLN